MSRRSLPPSWSLWVISLRVRGWLKQNAGLIRRLATVAASALVGLIICRFIAAPMQNEILTSYLVAVGAMIGGATAVVLSLSIFLLQGVADLYSSRYFDEYANDWRQQAAYLGIAAVVVALFGAGLYSVGRPDFDLFEDRVFIVTSLVLVGGFFALIDWQLENVLRKVVPANAIVFLEQRAMQSLRHISDIATRVAGILSPRLSHAGSGIALSAAYGSVAQPYVNDLDLQIEMLSELSLKLVERKELETAKRGLDACGRVLSRYVEARSGSTVAIPSLDVVLAIKSDSQRFLDVNLQRLNRAGRQFMKAGLDDLSPYVINIYREVADKAKNVKSVNAYPSNPILETVLGYLKQYIDSGLEHDDIEVLFQAAIAYGDIAVAAAKTGNQATVFAINVGLEELAQAALQLGETSVVDQCTEALHKIIVAVFSSSLINRELVIEQALESIANLANILSNAAPIANGFVMENSIEKGFFGLYRVLNEVGALYGPKRSDEENAQYRRDLVILFEAIRGALRRVADGTKAADSLLSGSIGRLIFDLNKMIVGLMEDPAFADVRDDLRKALKRLIHTPYFFARAALSFNAGSNSFRDLANAVGMTGVLAAQRLEEPGLVKECISSLDAIVEQSLEKNVTVHGYDEPRLMKAVCALGVLGLRRGWAEIVDDVIRIVVKFELKYFTKYFSSPPTGFQGEFDPYQHTLGGLANADQLRREVTQWMNEFEYERLNGSFGLGNDVESMLYDVIEPEDIAVFILAVWGAQ